MWILKHITDVTVQPKLTSLTVISAVDEDSSLSGLKETAGQVHQRTFPCTGLSDDCHIGTSRNFQVEVAEHLFFSIGILE